MTAQTTFYSLEAHTRLDNNWKLRMRGRFFAKVDALDPFNTFRNDDFLSFELITFF